MKNLLSILSFDNTLDTNRDKLMIYDTLTDIEKKYYGEISLDGNSKSCVFKLTASIKLIGEPVGIIVLDDTQIEYKENKIYLDKRVKDVNIGIMVNKNYRRQGVAKILLKKAIEWFKNSDYETMTYVVRSGNTTSENFIKNAGFAFLSFDDNKQEIYYVISNPMKLEKFMKD